MREMNRTVLEAGVLLAIDTFFRRLAIRELIRKT